MKIKDGKMPKLQLKEAALDPADGTPPYSSSQRPIRLVSARGRPTMDLRRLLSSKSRHIPLFS